MSDETRPAEATETPQDTSQKDDEEFVTMLPLCTWESDNSWKAMETRPRIKTVRESWYEFKSKGKRRIT